MPKFSKYPLYILVLAALLCGCHYNIAPAQSPQPVFEEYTSMDTLRVFLESEVFLPVLSETETETTYAVVSYSDPEHIGQRDKANKVRAIWELENGARLTMDVSLQHMEGTASIPHYFEKQQHGNQTLYVGLEEGFVGSTGELCSYSCRIYMPLNSRLYYFQATYYLTPDTPEGFNAEALYEDILARLLQH